MKLDSIDTYQMYRAIHAHFTSDSYDFFENKGRIRGASFENLLKKSYYHAIEKLAKKFDAKELRDYFVSNMLSNNGKYIFDCDTEGKRIYTDYIRRKESRKYIFTQDVNRVVMELEKTNAQHFWDSTRIESGQHPMLFRMFVGCFLSPETMCILDKINNFIPEWDNGIDDKMFYPEISFKLKKLSPFIMIKDFSPYIDIVESISEENLAPTPFVGNL